MTTRETITAAIVWVTDRASVRRAATALSLDAAMIAFVDARVAMGGGGVSDGDRGDVVVSDSGATWLFDPSVVTAAAKTVLDDANVGAMRTTLGAAAASHTHAQADVTGLVDALAAKVDDVEKGAAGGVATLDGGGKVPVSQLPAIVVGETFTVGSQAAMLALAAQMGDVAIRTDLSNARFILTGTDPTVLGSWADLTHPADAVSSVHGRTGNVTAETADYSGFYLRHDTAAQGLTAPQKTNARTNLGLGTAAVYDVPASGDAGATETVLGNDTRLADQRTPSNLSVTTAKFNAAAVAPSAAALTETSGPTKLTVGAIADGEYARRVGTTLVGGTPGGASLTQAFAAQALG